MAASCQGAEWYGRKSRYLEKYGFETEYQSRHIWQLNYFTPRIFCLLDGEKKTSILQGLERLRVVLSDTGGIICVTGLCLGLGSTIKGLWDKDYKDWSASSFFGRQWSGSGRMRWGEKEAKEVPVIKHCEHQNSSHEELRGSRKNRGVRISLVRELGIFKNDSHQSFAEGCSWGLFIA